MCSCVSECVCVCVCTRIRERKGESGEGRERQREGENKKRKRKGGEKSGRELPRLLHWASGARRLRKQQPPPPQPRDWRVFVITQPGRGKDRGHLPAQLRKGGSSEKQADPQRDSKEQPWLQACELHERAGPISEDARGLGCGGHPPPPNTSLPRPCGSAARQGVLVPRFTSMSQIFSPRLYLGHLPIQRSCGSWGPPRDALLLEAVGSPQAESAPDLSSRERNSENCGMEGNPTGGALRGMTESPAVTTVE